MHHPYHCSGPTFFTSFRVRFDEQKPPDGVGGVYVPPENIIGIGEDAPVTCNHHPDGTPDDIGQGKNRRVEVWLAR